MEVTKNFSNHLLIAMPTLEDDFFSKGVIYIYKHTLEGAMGITINKSLEITLEKLFDHLNIEITNKNIEKHSVLSGGPVNPEKGFIIYNQNKGDSSQIAISASKEILCNIGQGKGPNHFIIALGYTGWEAGQLEKEINQNDWLLTPFSSEILFSTSLEKRWAKAAELIGIFDMNYISSHIGHA